MAMGHRQAEGPGVMAQPPRPGIDKAALVDKVAQHLEATGEQARLDAARDLIGLAEVAEAPAVRLAVQRRLVHARPEVRAAALHVAGGLARLGDAPSAAAVFAAFGDADESVRRAAALALGELGGEELPAAAAGIVADAAALGLRDPAWQVRAAAACAIERLSKASSVKKQAAESAVCKLLQDENAEVRKAAGRIAAPRVLLGEPAAVAAALRASADGRVEVRKVAAAVLLELRQGDGETVKAVAEVLQDSQWEIRYAAVRTLGRLASVSEAARGPAKVLLVKALRDEQAEVREAALDGARLTAQGRRDSAVAEAAAELLGDESERVRAKAFVAVRMLAEKRNFSLLKIVTRHLLDARPECRLLSIRTIRALGSGSWLVGSAEPRQASSQFVAPLVALLGAGEADGRVRRAALSALRVLGAEAGDGSAEAAARARLEDESWTVRLEAVMALSALVPRGYGSNLGDMLAVMLACTCWIVLIATAWTQDKGVTVPYEPGPWSSACYVVSSIARLASGLALVLLVNKGRLSGLPAWIVCGLALTALPVAVLGAAR